MVDTLVILAIACFTPAFSFGLSSIILRLDPLSNPRAARVAEIPAIALAAGGVACLIIHGLIT